MFKHGKTGEVYYSVREKIKHYNKIAFNDKSATAAQKQHAMQRLNELTAIDKSTYIEPTIIVTDDKRFGNGISKPRLCVAIKEDSKNRIFVAPITKTTSNQVILDNDIERQISKTADGKNKWINRDDIYEVKYISPHSELTERDKRKIKRLYK